MAETTHILSAYATTANRLPDLGIKDGQLIFLKDSPKIILDIDGKRKFFNQIIVLNNDEERSSILAPIAGAFYFVISTAILWAYQSNWIQCTTTPEEIVCVGVEFPELGSSNRLYINTEQTNISIWDGDQYVVVADKTESISIQEIDNLFLE